MMPNKIWKPAISILIVLCVTFTLIEPNTFARTPQVQTPVENHAPSTPSPHKSGKKKWIVILTVVAGVVVAAILVAQNKDSSKPPTITVGPPTVG